MDVQEVLPTRKLERRSRLWLGILWFAALLMASYGPTLYRLLLVWLDDSDASHSLIVPFAAAAIAWDKRAQLAALQPAVSWLGLIPIVLGALMLCIGPPTLPTFVFISRMALLFSIVGVILFLCGFAVLRILAFPLLLLILMIPLPGFIYERLTFPLQIAASATAEQMFLAAGVTALREGNIIHLAGQSLSVNEACSGLRSLYALTFLTLTFAYFFAQKQWIRWILGALLLPVAIFANAWRIFMTGILGQYDSRLIHGIYHDLLGWSVFIIAFAILYLFYRLSVMIERAINRSHAYAR